ncbi:hypothetical protein METSCH_A09930 [Metschnikowia aff. pulcherrima]|uniref:Uncharacterized protein n=1 Tax=Metschnikowia aff. pulcherrima TaxID=2163413 RepID=A0A4P6XJR8_9ASCO|nr:hypothetical protein METSCH_A09930 [Metschnikowia aff. pulcherrima]
MAAELSTDIGDQHAKRLPSRRFTGALRSLLGSIPIPFMLGTKPNQDKDKGSGGLRQLNFEDSENLGSIASKLTNLRGDNDRTVLPENVMPQPLGKNVITTDDSDSEVEITRIEYPSPLRAIKSGKFSENLIVSRRDRSLRKRLPISTEKNDILSRDRDLLQKTLSEQRLPRKRKKFKSFESNKKRVIINPSSESESEVTGEPNVSVTTPKSHNVSQKLSQSLQSPKHADYKSAGSENNTNQTAVQNTVSDEKLNEKHNLGQDKVLRKPKPSHEKEFHYSEDELDTSRVEYVGLNSALSSTYEAELLRLIEEAENSRLYVTRTQVQAGDVDDEKLLAEIEAQFKLLAMPRGEVDNTEGENAIEKQAMDFQGQSEKTQFPDHDNPRDESCENVFREQNDKDNIAARSAIDDTENVIEEGTMKNQEDQNQNHVDQVAIELNASGNIKLVSPPAVQDLEKNVDHEDVPRLFQGSHYPRLSVPQPSSPPRNSTFTLSSPHKGVLEAGVVHQIIIHSETDHPFHDNSIDVELRQDHDYALGANTEEHAEDREKRRVRNRKRRQGAERKLFRLQRKNRLLKVESIPKESEVIENGMNEEISSEVEMARADSNSADLVEKSKFTEEKDMDEDVRGRVGNSEGSMKELAPGILNDNVNCTNQSREQGLALLQKEGEKSDSTELACGNGPGHSTDVECLKSTKLIGPEDVENSGPFHPPVQSTQTPSLPIVSKTQQNQDENIHNVNKADYQNTERSPILELRMIKANIEAPEQSVSGKSASPLPIDQDNSGSFLPLSSQKNVQQPVSPKNFEFQEFESSPHQLGSHDKSSLQTPHAQEELGITGHENILDIISISLGLSSRGSNVSLQSMENDANSEPQPHSQGKSNSIPNSDTTFLGTVIPNSSQSIQASQRRMPITSQIAINSSQESQMNSTIESLKQVKEPTKLENSSRLRNKRVPQRTVRGETVDFASSEIVTVDSESEPELAPVSIAEIIRRKFAEAGTKFDGFKVDDDSDD